MPLLRRISSSRQVRESKNNRTKKTNVANSQNAPSPIINRKDSMSKDKLQCERWMQNSFFNNTQTTPVKNHDTAESSFVSDGSEQTNEYRKITTNRESSIHVSKSRSKVKQVDEKETPNIILSENCTSPYVNAAKNKKRTCKGVQNILNVPENVDPSNITKNSELCTSTPKSKRKKLTKKSVPCLVEQPKQDEYSSQHKSFDESDSLFAGLDISGECEQQHMGENTHHWPIQSESSNSSRSKTNIPDRKESCIIGEIEQSSQKGELKTPGLSPDYGQIVCGDKVDGHHVEQKRLGSWSAMVSNAASVSDPVSHSDSELFSEFDTFFPGSESEVPPIKQSSTENKNDAINHDSGDPHSTIQLKSLTLNSHLPSAKNFDHAVKRSVPCSDFNNTPATTGSMSLKERLKQSLQRNAKIATPKGRAKLLQEIMVEQVKKDVEMLKEEVSEFDVGPFYGLPSKVKELFNSQRGIDKLYDWQHECLSLEALKKGRNLIYSLPTSGGKTLVAEILILKELLCKKRDALLVLPFVSIVQEKVKGLSGFSLELDFLVEEYAGSKGCFPPKKRRNKKSLYIATIEKANSLVNSLIDEGRLDNLGLVVVDELHMLGEGGGRGATLEMCLTKLMHCTGNTQIIGMSATLNNIKDLETYLDADLYTNEFRPVELKEYVKMEDMIYSINSKAFCPEDKIKHSRPITFKYDTEMRKKDPDHLAGLVLEIIPQNSCLVFCPTKKNCENVADLICRLAPREMTLHKKVEKKALLQGLSSEGQGELCPVLRRTIPYGVAYHHSGLTMDERKTLEEAYGEGILCTLCCTSTLAAGVNLPAKRVILRSPYVGESFLSRSQYKQMIGRAGRAGIDSSGESILVMQKKDKAKLLELVSGPCDSCHSSLLYMDGKGMRALLLTTIGLKVTETRTSVCEFARRSLCYVQTRDSEHDISKTSDTAVQNLLDLGLVTEETDKPDTVHQCNEPMLQVTKLGKAVFKGSIDLDRGSQLYSDLCAAREALCVANYLHLLYLVTPYDMVDQVKPTWIIYLDQVSSFSESEQRVADVIGVTESYLSRKASGQRIRKGVDEFVVRRFYLTLVLYQLWQQQTVWQVAHRFHLPRGFVQQLLNSAAAFASCVTRFCQELDDFWAYQDLLLNFVKKLSYCVTVELIPLMEIPGVKIGRAKQLYTSGYKSLHQVAHANPETLVREMEHMPRKVAKQIITAAKMLLVERVESLREEVDEMMALDTTEPDPTRLQDIEVRGEHDSQTSVPSSWGDLPLSDWDLDV